MRTDFVVAAQGRESRGKNEARRIRKQGLIPGVVYGASKDAVAVTISPKEITKVIRSKTGHNTIFNLDIRELENTPVMVVDEQYDPIKGTLLHVDLKRIDLSKRLRVAVPVVTEGEAKGIKAQGGIMDVVTRAVEVECLPEEIPDQFVVDVTELMMGQSKRVSDIPISGSLRMLTSGDLVIAHITGIKEEEVAAPVEAVAAPVEPEVVKKGKKEEEAAEAEAKPKKK